MGGDLRPWEQPNRYIKSVCCLAHRGYSLQQRDVGLELVGPHDTIKRKAAPMISKNLCERHTS
jgi:hypothetical protein